MTKRDITWIDFTDEELSMIASELAALVVEPERGAEYAGRQRTGGFCCHEHQITRDTVTRDPRKQTFLEHFAYVSMGCGWPRDTEYDRNVRQTNLDRFLAAVAGR